MEYSELRKQATDLGHKGPWDKQTLEDFLSPKESSAELLLNLTDLYTSNTIDKSSIKIPKLTEETIDVILGDSGMQEYRKNKLQPLLDQDEIGLPNFDLPIVASNIAAFYNNTTFDEYDLTNLKEYITDIFGLDVHNGFNRGETLYSIAEHFGFYVYSFPLLSDIHTKIVEGGIPYEIAIGISDGMINDIYQDGKIKDEKYEVSKVKSFMGYKDKFYNTYGKRLDKNEFTIENDCELLNNFILSGTGYILFPKFKLKQETKNYLLLNQTMSEHASMAMKRGMYDGKNPKEHATKDWVAGYIMYNKIKHKLK